MTHPLKNPLAIILCALVVSACAQTEQQPRIGMSNPASAHCAKMGGTLQIKDTPRGQVGICVLPDGSQVEEWELFRRDNPLSPKK
ncbi:DUF333 domain-containing protein [Comamonas odontotermitis]|uniref:putative hemolysin n=1 Tax=Comamonas odontotermitis TaxID=379895 RepID=UPI00374FEFAE